jgi:flagellar basal-body rod protein FlgB
MPITNFLFDDPYDRMTARHLGYLVRRSELVAANIANADTPKYKSKDLDFRQTLAREVGATTGSLAMSKTNSRHLGTGDPSLGDARLVVEDEQTRVDRNTVNLEKEMEKGAETSLLFDAAATFLKRKGALMQEALKP